MAAERSQLQPFYSRFRALAKQIDVRTTMRLMSNYVIRIFAPLPFFFFLVKFVLKFNNVRSAV